MISFDITVNYQQPATNTPGAITFQGDTLPASGRLTGIGTSVTQLGQFMIVDTNSLGQDSPCGPFTVDVICKQVNVNTIDIELTFTYQPDALGNFYFDMCAGYTSLSDGGIFVEKITGVSF